MDIPFGPFKTPALCRLCNTRWDAVTASPVHPDQQPIVRTCEECLDIREAAEKLSRSRPVLDGILWRGGTSDH